MVVGNLYIVWKINEFGVERMLNFFTNKCSAELFVGDQSVIRKENLRIEEIKINV